MWFTTTGTSQALPYFGDASEITAKVGCYSKWLPAIIENLSAWSWIVGGLYFGKLYMDNKGQVQVQADKAEELAVAQAPAAAAKV